MKWLLVLLLIPFIIASSVDECYYEYDELLDRWEEHCPEDGCYYEYNPLLDRYEQHCPDPEGSGKGGGCFIYSLTKGQNNEAM